MRVSTLVRGGVLVATVAMLAACGESPNAPQSTSPRASARPLTVSADVAGEATTSHTFTFVVDPNQSQSYSFAHHSVYFPAQSICDPAVSGYGPTLWNAPCQALQAPITITATVSNRNGHTLVDFEPALRFVPSQTVLLTVHDHAQWDATVNYTLVWLNPATGQWVNEGLTDPSMKGSLDRQGNKVIRRIKHFSGYNVTAGNCDPSDPSCTGCDPMLGC